jgi:hypothetical protein
VAHDVFVSYASSDKLTADAVCATLESVGVRCWIAPRDVTPGMDYGGAIVEGIRASRIMIVVFSAHANESQHIKREVERAVSHGLVVLPFRIENTLPTASLEYFIGSVHWLDAMSPPLESHLKELQDFVQLSLDRLRGDHKEPPTARPSPRSPKPSPTPAPAPSPSVLKFCTHCGSSNARLERFCNKCGTRLMLA